MVYDHAVKAFGKIYLAGETVPEPEQEKPSETIAPASSEGNTEPLQETAQPPVSKRTSKAKGKALC